VVFFIYRHFSSSNGVIAPKDQEDFLKNGDVSMFYRGLAHQHVEDRNSEITKLKAADGYKAATPKDGELSIEEELALLTAADKEVNAGKAANVKYFKEYTQNILNALVSDALKKPVVPKTLTVEEKKEADDKEAAEKVEAEKKEKAEFDALTKDEQKKKTLLKEEATLLKELRKVTSKKLETALESMKKTREAAHAKKVAEAKKAATATTPAPTATPTATPAPTPAPEESSDLTDKELTLTVEEFKTVVTELAKTVKDGDFMTKYGKTMYGEHVKSFGKIWDPKTEKKEKTPAPTKV